MDQVQPMELLVHLSARWPQLVGDSRDTKVTVEELHAEFILAQPEGVARLSVMGSPHVARPDTTVRSLLITLRLSG